jgi:hypothetical protein
MAEVRIASIDDMISSQIRKDGNYDVICRSGKFEVVSPQDLQLNNVCPHRATDSSLDVIDIQRRPDGRFGVICKDTTRRIVTREEIFNNTACKKTIPPLLTGHYITKDPGPFCKNYWIHKLEIESPTKFTFRLQCSQSELGLLFKCDNNKCTQGLGQRVILIVSSTPGRLRYRSYGVWTVLHYLPKGLDSILSFNQK